MQKVHGRGTWDSRVSNVLFIPEITQHVNCQTEPSANLDSQRPSEFGARHRNLTRSQRNERQRDRSPTLGTHGPLDQKRGPREWSANQEAKSAVPAAWSTAEAKRPGDGVGSNILSRLWHGAFEYVSSCLGVFHDVSYKASVYWLLCWQRSSKCWVGANHWTMFCIIYNGTYNVHLLNHP